MKLLYVVAKAEYFLSHRIALAKAAQKQAFNVAVATTPFQVKDIPKVRGIEIFPVRFRRGSVNIMSELLTIFDLFRVISIFRPKIVHNVALKPALYGTLIARLFALQTVNAINGFGYIFTSSHLKAKILKPFVKLALKLILNHKSVRVLVQNTQDFEDCQSLLPKAKISLILGSGVDTKTFFPVSHDGVFTFTLVARMLWSKGVGEFVDAAKIFKKLYPAKQVRFLLVGSPDEQNPESIPLDTLKTWHAEAVVEWREYEEDIQSIYAQSNVAVLPSYREGMPKSLLEAMACGLPIITSDTRGCADIVSEGNGIKVPVKNVDALTNAFDVLFSDFDLVQKLGLQSRADAERLYCLGRINSAVIKFYKETQKNSE